MGDCTYKIIRFYRDSDHPSHQRIIKRGLSLDEAQEHCRRDDTHELDSEGMAIWFDGYEHE